MVILCYHAIDPDWRSPMSVDMEVFRQHCEWLAQRRTVVPLDEALLQFQEDGPMPPRTITLTFDDGFASVAEHAWPALHRYGLTATVFLVVGTLTGDVPAVDWVDDPPEHPLGTLTIEQVRALQDEGLHFASHSWAHRDLTTLELEECVEDLRRSRRTLATLLDRPVTTLAYPYGRHNATVRQAAQIAGYTSALSLPDRWEPSGPFAVPRVGIHGGNGVGTLRIKASRGYPTLRGSRLWRGPKRASDGRTPKRDGLSTT